MQANYLQSLLNTNAAKIASKHAMHDMCVQRARQERMADNKSIMYDEFAKAANYRKQLARLHTIQKALHAELESHYRCNRIDAKVRKLKAMVGALPVNMCEMTSHEAEAALDIRIAAHKLKNFH